jgi:hypothetical protein
VRCRGSNIVKTVGSEMVVRLSALCGGCHFSPQMDYFSAFGTHFRYRLSKPQGLVGLEGSGKLIQIIRLIQSRTRNHLEVPLPLCYRMPYS